MQKILCSVEKCLSYKATKQRYERQMKSLEVLADFYKQKFLEASEEVKGCYQ